MLKYVQYTLAYISLSMLWIYIIAIILSAILVVMVENSNVKTKNKVDLILKEGTKVLEEWENDNER